MFEKWRPIFWVLLILLVGEASLTAQDDEFVPQDEEFVPQQDEEFVPSGDEEGGILAEPTEEEQADFEAIDDLLMQDEEILADPGIYSYDPGARRDPFRSLIQQREQAPTNIERPPGIRGLLIDEIQLEGVFVLDDGPVAQIISASQETSFLLKIGERLWDGEVVSIAMDEVVFRQTVDDPTARKPFRDVVKKLSP